MDSHENNLQAAYDKAAVTMNKKPTTDNIKAYQAARKALDDYKAELKAKANPEARRFDNLLEVLGYLSDEGWKVSKSKLYEDQNKIGKEKDGTFAKKNVDEYARLLLTRLDGSGDEEQGLAEKKTKLEIDILEEKKEEVRRNNEIEAGRWVLKSDVESMLASRAKLLMDSLGPEFIHRHAEDLIRLVEGNTVKAPDLIAFWLREVEEAFDRYSRPGEFAVPAVNENKEEEIGPQV